LAFIKVFADPAQLRSRFEAAQGAVLFQDGVDTEWLAEHKIQFIAGWSRMVLKNVPIWSRLRARRFLHSVGLREQFVFSASQPENSFLRPADANWLHSAMERFLAASYRIRMLRLVLWCSAVPLMLLTVIALIGLFRSRWHLSLLAGLPVLTAALMSLFMEAPYFRSNFFLIPFLACSAVALVQRERAADSLEECEVCSKPTAHRRVYRKWGYWIRRCLQCGLGSTVTDSLEPRAIYNEAYFQGGRKDGYANYAASEAVLRREFRRTLIQLRSLRPNGRLLEIGCAYGFFLSEAAQHYRCTGIEIANAAAEACRSRGLDVVCGAVEEHRDFIARRGPFDAVVMLDCIEHLRNPSEVLSVIACAMGNDGVLLLSTGDWESLPARVAGRWWRLMTPPQHLFFFSPRNLQKLLERAGFEVVSIRRPWKLIPLGLAFYQFGQRVGLRLRALEKLNRIQIPINLFDTIQVVALRRGAERQ
jgi:SAM-dependent methyltransferase